MAACIRNLCRLCISITRSPYGRVTYHISSQICLFILLETLEVLQDTGTGVFDVLFGNLQGLFQLGTTVIIDSIRVSESQLCKTYLKQTFLGLANLVTSSPFGIDINKAMHGMTNASKDLVAHESSA